ncbi:hypothetical protein CCR75_006608 [Bremia lactucae]|uniref:Uncharacterized protein n=1 Tax=Bremia lactucae TaxID=4779 RepID=A0A976FI41_BRELC|nr:hypothetical protein CCR75_006608 [Bremia lactucae]
MAEFIDTPPSNAIVSINASDQPLQLTTSVFSPETGKRAASEAFDGDSGEDFKDSETTLDDVLMSLSDKKRKLLDDELPDVDDNEEFTHQAKEVDTDLTLGLVAGESGETIDATGLGVAIQNDGHYHHFEHKRSEAEESDHAIDIVDVDDEDESVGSIQESLNSQEPFQDDETTTRALLRAENQREARVLLQQLDDAVRSKLCLLALQKYGEELFYGHEDARDGILVAACAQDAVLSLVRDATQARERSERGSSATVPVELDDEDETGSYDEEEDEMSEERGDEYDEIVVISEEDDEENQMATMRVDRLHSSEE